jgi:alkylation response protein AidB-like acyl-CoA dehydrogenase
LKTFAPAHTFLGEPGTGVAIFGQFIEWERIGVFTSHIGAMEPLEISIARARTRKQFFQAIGKFQAVSHRIANMKAQLEAAPLPTYKACRLLDHAKNVSLDASIVELFVGESFVPASLIPSISIGGYGYLTEYEVERVFRDSQGSTTYRGLPRGRAT